MTYSEDYFDAILDMAYDLGESLILRKTTTKDDFIDPDHPSKGRIKEYKEYSVIGVDIQFVSFFLTDHMERRVEGRYLLALKGVDVIPEKGDMLTVDKVYRPVTEVNLVNINGAAVAAVVYVDG